MHGNVLENDRPFTTGQQVCMISIMTALRAAWQRVASDVASVCLDDKKIVNGII